MKLKPRKHYMLHWDFLRTIYTPSGLIVGEPIKLTQNIKVYTNQYWLPGICRRKHNRELREVGYDGGVWKQ